MMPFLSALMLASSGAVNPSPHYLFYLHGAIVEEHGARGVSPVHGAYDYPGIIAAFRQGGFEVISEIRPRNTDVRTYARMVSGQVESLIAKGVPAEHVTVVGASKGAVIAALISSQINNRRVRFALLASCNDWLVRTYNPHLNGQVLSIYEASDEIGKSCATIAKRSPRLARFREIRLTTGLGHGFVYRPLAQWFKPVTAWARR